MFTTRQQAIDYLVSIGKPLTHAKVAIHEGFCYDDKGETDDALRREEKDDTFAFMAEPNPANSNNFKRVEITEREALAVYLDMCGPDGYYKLTEQGWEFDGELVSNFDKEGNFVE